MTFGEFRNTEQFFMANEISFVYTNGEEMDIDNINEETLQGIEVIETHSNGGYLEIMIN